MVIKHTLTVPGTMLTGARRSGSVLVDAVATDPDTDDVVVLREVRVDGEAILYTGDTAMLPRGDLQLELPATDDPGLAQPFAYRITLALDHLEPASYPVYTLALTTDRNLDDVDADDAPPVLAPGQTQVVLDRLTRALGEVDHGDVTGALELDATDGGHLLALTGDTDVTFINEPGARTVYLKVTGTGTLTVAGAEVDYSADPLVVAVYAGGVWMVRQSIGDAGPGLA